MTKIGHTCVVCKKTFNSKDCMSLHLVRNSIFALIQQDYPTCTQDDFICLTDLSKYRAKYVHSLLESEKGELSELDKEVLDSLQENEIISANIENEFEQDWTLGEKLADRIASFGGSWTFLILFTAFLLVWILLNTIPLFWKSVDPYPFILLNLLLSCLAAVQAPIIMMSQNRQEDKDRLRAEHDYQVNLKAELEIRQIHEKLDHLLSKQWERLVEIQEVQMEQMAELTKLKKEKKGSKQPAALAVPTASEEGSNRGKSQQDTGHGMGELQPGSVQTEPVAGAAGAVETVADNGEAESQGMRGVQP